MFAPGLPDENSPEATTDALNDTPAVAFSASSQPAAPPNGHVTTGAAGPVGGSTVHFFLDIIFFCIFLTKCICLIICLWLR